MARRAHGPATILAIGTATPSTIFDQIAYPDHYFCITNSEHMSNLKEKFKRICEKSTIKKRHMHLPEEVLRENPELHSYTTPSLDKRQDIVVVEIPNLGKEAANKAIDEWGQPISKITHLIFCTTTSGNMPGADYQLMKLLGLSPSVKRFMLYMQGCSAGGTVLRMAKDIAENNIDARVLAICSEMTLHGFRGPNETDLCTLIGHALFSDGAGAVVVGSNPIMGAERPLFQLVSTTQTIVPGSEGSLFAHLKEVGITFHVSKTIPSLIGENIENVIKEAFHPLGILDWNSIFWIVHPGGRAILDQVETKLCLNPEKLESSRAMLGDYGNMMSATVLFVLDEIRKSSSNKGLGSTGEGLDWGILLGFGPGLSIEAVVLHSMPIN